MKETKTEFFLAAGVVLVATVLVGLGWLDAESWESIVQWISGSYLGARTGLKAIASVKGAGA